MQQSVTVIDFDPEKDQEMPLVWTIGHSNLDWMLFFME